LPTYCANIDLRQWSVFEDFAEFGHEAGTYQIGWSHSGIDQMTKIKPSKLWETTPSLNYTIAHFYPDRSLKNSLNKASKELQNLFFQFYQKDLKQIILRVRINNSSKLSSLISRAEYYKYLTPTFWVNNNIYNKSEALDGKKYSPFWINWEGIFTCIWTNYCQLENRPILSQMEFMDYLSALSQLSEDITVNPLNQLNDENYHDRLRFFISNSHPEDCKDFGMHPDRWKKEPPKNKEGVFLWRINDARDYLNSFLQKYTSTTTKNALELFLVEMFESFGNALEKKQILTKCSFCGNYFKFSKGQKYCSFLRQGKDCAKSARNKRFYAKHRNKILPKARKVTRELRKLYRQKGIKK